MALLLNLVLFALQTTFASRLLNDFRSSSCDDPQVPAWTLFLSTALALVYKLGVLALKWVFGNVARRLPPYKAMKRIAASSLLLCSLLSPILATNWRSCESMIGSKGAENFLKSVGGPLSISFMILLLAFAVCRTTLVVWGLREGHM